MAEWEDADGDGWYFTTEIKGRRAAVYQRKPGDVWRFNFPPMMGGGDIIHLAATTAEAAKLEAMHIVGEWAKSLAVEAAELRGRMVGEAMNAEASPWDFQTMVVCETCGNKRCPHATDAARECTGSNEPGQVPEEVEDDG